MTRIPVRIGPDSFSIELDREQWLALDVPEVGDRLLVEQRGDVALAIVRAHRDGRKFVRLIFPLPPGAARVRRPHFDPNPIALRA